MRKGLLAASCVFAVCAASLWAQQPEESAQPDEAAQQKKEMDAVGQQASKLEGELGKYKDASPEAADVMVQLVDLYHEHGRVFGLIRIARRFTQAHPGDERHQAMMLKLIDALAATSRDDDLITTSKQFLGRYIEAPEYVEVAQRVADLLERQNKRTEAAEIYHQAWKAKPGADRYPLAVRAVRLYMSVSNNQSYQQGASLAEEVFRSAGKDDFAEFIGRKAFDSWVAAQQWAKVNLVGNELLKRGLPKGKGRTHLLHRQMAENYTRLGQHANAAESYRKARSLKDSAELHRSQIYHMFHGNAKAADLAKQVQQYFQKYPQLEDRFYLQGLLAHAYLREEDKANGLKTLAQVLPHDAANNNNVSVYIRTMTTEEGNLPQVEKVLKNAIAKNEKERHILRYALAFEVYRDRMKDTGKMRATLRELIADNPGNSHYSQQAIYTLLGSAESDAQFQAEVDRILKIRQANLHLGNFRDRPAEWAKQAARSDDEAVKKRAASLQKQLAAADNDAFVKGWMENVSRRDGTGSNWRMGQLQAGKHKDLSDGMAWHLLYQTGYYLRHYAPGDQRRASVGAFEELSNRFPESEQAGYLWLEAAYNYGTAEQAHAAAQSYMQRFPTSGNGEAWRQAMYCLNRSLTSDKDDEPTKKAKQQQVKSLVVKGYQWLGQCMAEHGAQSHGASGIGDILFSHGLTDEAMEYWKANATSTDFFTGDHHESWQSAIRMARQLEGQAKVNYLKPLLTLDSPYHGSYAQALAGHYLTQGEFQPFVQVCQQAAARLRQHGILGSGFDEGTLNHWMAYFGGTSEEPRELTAEQLPVFYRTLANLEVRQSSAQALLKLLALPGQQQRPVMDRLLDYRRVSMLAGNANHYWDQIMPAAQDLLSNKQYLEAATLMTGMLSHVTNLNQSRQKQGRDMVAQSYSRIGAVGLTIDDDSPIAPLLQAAFMLRLGDRRLAFEGYLANQDLFDEHRDEMPVDFLLFVCERHAAAGGDENFERVEDILRGWLVRYSESEQYDDVTKAKVQLQLARSFFQARRYEIARSEFLTVKNRFPDTPEALEAEFGIGETFMAQKVYDQAEAVFEKLAESRDNDVVVRAEFLRGVLAHRRGDIDEAREIFRGVLERVPDIDLANLTLFNLAGVYEAEERYIDQLILLQTVGRLGRHSKRWHRPGSDLSIVVQDNDLGISRGHSKIPVIVTTVPGGDRERIFLTSGGAGKGLFRADLRTQLGQATPDDHMLQLTGKDVIRCDYPDDFKADFKHIPLSDVDIGIAASAEFEVASSLIVDEEEETFTDQLRRTAEQEEDQRVSQQRPPNQIKPGNQIYLRVKDQDRDLGNEPDEVVVKLSAQSGDEVQAVLSETQPHSGMFVGTAQTGELPAGAIASDSSIEHSPLMAIDRDPDSYWMSEPDGATPKEITVDMKDLRLVSKVRISTPNPDNQAPVRADLMGSNDGQFWFRVASNPPQKPVQPVAGEFREMTRRVYAGNYTKLKNWDQVVDLTKNGTPISEEQVDEIFWMVEDEESEEATKAFAAVWHGKLLQPRAGAMRISVIGMHTALVIDGKLELPLDSGVQTVDVYLESGAHDLTIFSATTKPTTAVGATRARASYEKQNATLVPFHPSDFDLDQPLANVAAVGAAVQPPQVLTADGDWEFRFPSVDLRYVRLVINEYRGDAVALSNIEVRGEEDDQVYIPTEADVLELANNSVLEMAGGDVIVATYADERTQTESGGSRLLTRELRATYHNATIAPIAYDFVENNNGTISTIAKDLMRIDPGERFIVQVTDYDMDRTDARDTVRIEVMVNDEPPVELVATETEEYSGQFTKEVDTTAAAGGEQELVVQPGDRIYCRYIDTQNTFPGHSVPREAVLYVRQPTEGLVRVLESRYTPPSADSEATQGQSSYHLPGEGQQVSRVAFEVPLTIEVIDRDAAKDSRSTVDVKLTTSDGAEVEVECEISSSFRDSRFTAGQSLQKQELSALEEGRFIGQIILQLGGKDSPDVVPLRADMPRSLIGGGRLDEQQQDSQSLLTRVLNVTGKDMITAAYNDELRPGGSQQITSQGRLVTSGQLACTDRDYENQVEQLHVGEKMFLLVNDADRDQTDERDVIEVQLESQMGEKETLKLEETLAHSGVFSGSILLRAAEMPTPMNLDQEEPLLETYFGDAIKVTYIDPSAGTEEGTLELTREVPVVIGTDGLLAAFSKTFNDETLAVETKFHIAESYFELFKSHKSLERTDEQKFDLQAGRRILREVLEDYPDPKYVPRVAYLLGQFAQELENYDEAIQSYELITRTYASHSLAPDAQYKLAQCYELSGDFSRAVEEYVTLAATYPKSPLIANVMIRISDYFYKNENFEVAARVGEKFLDKFTTHQHAPRIAFRVGQAYYKGELYNKASSAFDEFAKVFPDDDLCADAIFWSGESYRMANNNQQAFRRYNRCRWDFPASEAAKYARGRLTLPEMLNQFEQEAASLEN